MPLSDVARITALVPRWRGVCSERLILISARPSGVSEMSVTEPTGRPPMSTLLPTTSCPAVGKTALTL